MDSVFGAKNFRNEIIWHYSSGGASKKRFSKKHDVILFYTKTNNYTFNPQYRPYNIHTEIINGVRYYPVKGGFRKVNIKIMQGKHKT